MIDHHLVQYSTICTVMVIYATSNEMVFEKKQLLLDTKFVIDIEIHLCFHRNLLDDLIDVKMYCQILIFNMQVGLKTV